MKIDGGIGFDPDGHRRAGGQRGGERVRRGVVGRDQPRPLPPHRHRRRRHREARVRHRDHRGLRPQPDDAGRRGQRPAAADQGPLHARDGQPDQAAHHQALLHAVVAPGATDARDDPGHPGHLEVVGDGRQARLPGRVLHAHADDAVLQSRREPLRQPQDPAGRRRRAHDRGGGRGGRRLLGARLHHRALPARGEPARARARCGQGGQDARRPDGVVSRVRRHRDRRREHGRRRTRRCASRSPSTARRPPTARCSSCTAGATCSPSSTRCPSGANG